MTTDLDKAKERQRLINAYHRTFETKEGKLVIEDMRAAFGTNSPAFRPDASGGYDTHLAAIRDGQRMVLLHIEAALMREAIGDANITEPQVKVIT